MWTSRRRDSPGRGDGAFGGFLRRLVDVRTPYDLHGDGKKNELPYQGATENRSLTEDVVRKRFHDLPDAFHEQTNETFFIRASLTIMEP